MTTQLTIADVLSGLADNASQLITPENVRDLVPTLRAGMAQIYVPATAAASVTISVADTYYEVTQPVWTLSADPYLFDESAGNGRLTYTGITTVMAHIACSLSISDAPNDTIHARLGKNGVTDSSAEQIRKIGSGGDTGSTAIHLITTMAPNDYISLWLKNQAATADITLNTANLQIVTSPM